MDIPGEDRISLLPELVLRHILGFLDTKQAVQTRILARSWKDLSVSLPVLNFNYDTWNHLSRNKDNQQHFITHVERLLLRNSSALRKLYLSCGDSCNGRRIRAWVGAAVGRYVEELHLELVSKRLFQLPGAIFTSGTKIFKIKSANLTSNYGTVQMPIQMCSSVHLKTLELVAVKLPQGLQPGQVHLECPVLESLIIRNCDHRNIQVLKISTPKLETLVIENECAVHTASSNAILNLCTPNLKSFETQGDGRYKAYHMENVPSLVTASCLQLSASLLDHHSPDDFGGLGFFFWCQLFVHLKSVTLWDIEGCDDEFRFLKSILENATLLRKMTITTQHVDMDKEKKLMEFSEKLLALPRASPSVSILFILRALPTTIHHNLRAWPRSVGFHRNSHVSRQLKISSE